LHNTDLLNITDIITDVTIQCIITSNLVKLTYKFSGCHLTAFFYYELIYPVVKVWKLFWLIIKIKKAMQKTWLLNLSKKYFIW